MNLTNAEFELDVMARLRDRLADGENVVRFEKATDTFIALVVANASQGYRRVEGRNGELEPVTSVGTTTAAWQSAHEIELAWAIHESDVAALADSLAQRLEVAA